MGKISILLGSVLGALGVALGAFGAHAFKPVLESNNRIPTFETAVKYHFFHALALILLGILMDKYHSKLLETSVWAFLMGIILFSGSLYILSLTGTTKWGAVAPFGGLSLIAGWVLLFLGVMKSV
jgi:uncharacterized membrane protein YgdD (TMEM256/DUF423 family)